MSRSGLNFEVLFFKTRYPLDPVAFLHRICADAAAAATTSKNLPEPKFRSKRVGDSVSTIGFRTPPSHLNIQDHAQLAFRPTRFVRRLVPSTKIRRANLKGLGLLAQDVLAEKFLAPDCRSLKFAIRPNIRHHTSDLTRQLVIETVAKKIGVRHSVDLVNYEALILVEVHKNVVGMSVVGPEYDRLKKFNLAEIRTGWIRAGGPGAARATADAAADAGGDGAQMTMVAGEAQAGAEAEDEPDPVTPAPAQTPSHAAGSTMSATSPSVTTATDVLPETGET